MLQRKGINSASLLSICDQSQHQLGLTPPPSKQPGLFNPIHSEGGRWDKSVQDIGGELLIVSQFTLYGDCRKGRRPSFDRSAAPEAAEKLYEKFVEKLRHSGLKVETGLFGAQMQVSIDNDGPVTLVLEREAGRSVSERSHLAPF
jgi:hypothetical protein